MKRKSFSPGALTAPLPPALVTVGDEEHSNIITVGWTGILSTVPPRTYVSVRPSRHSYGIIKQTREFVINLPSVKIAKEVDYCGIYTGAKVDKFAACSFTKEKSNVVSAPTLGECPIALECRVVEIIPMGSHDVFIADIVSVSCREDIIDKDGKMRFDSADLLAYAHGEYYALGEKVGRFGFSTDKVRTSKTLKQSTKHPAERLKTSSARGEKRSSPTFAVKDGYFDDATATNSNDNGGRKTASPTSKGFEKNRRPGEKKRESSPSGRGETKGKPSRIKNTPLYTSSTDGDYTEVRETRYSTSPEKSWKKKASRPHQKSKTENLKGKKPHGSVGHGRFSTFKKSEGKF